jgi:hypothetical protein
MTAFSWMVVDSSLSTLLNDESPPEPPSRFQSRPIQPVLLLWSVTLLTNFSGPGTLA